MVADVRRIPQKLNRIEKGVQNRRFRGHNVAQQDEAVGRDQGAERPEDPLRLRPMMRGVTGYDAIKPFAAARQILQRAAPELNVAQTAAVRRGLGYVQHGGREIHGRYGAGCRSQSHGDRPGSAAGIQYAFLARQLRQSQDGGQILALGMHLALSVMGGDGRELGVDSALRIVWGWRHDAYSGLWTMDALWSHERGPSFKTGAIRFRSVPGWETRGPAIMNIAGKDGTLKAGESNAICTPRAARTRIGPTGPTSDTPRA